VLEERTAAAAAAGMEAIGGLVGVVGLRVRDLQVLFGQVVHFVLKSGGDWVVVMVVGGFICR